MPVTRAPSVASASARMPPPQPTSSTRLPPNPLNTPRKYATRAALSACPPANGPAPPPHRPGMRSTGLSYFSDPERPPRRGSWSGMREIYGVGEGGGGSREVGEVGGGWGRLGEVVTER